LPENIHAHPISEGHSKFRGKVVDRSFEGKYDAKLTLPEGWVGGLKKILQ